MIAGNRNDPSPIVLGSLKAIAREVTMESRFTTAFAEAVRAALLGAEPEAFNVKTGTCNVLLFWVAYDLPGRHRVSVWFEARDFRQDAAPCG